MNIPLLLTNATRAGCSRLCALTFLLIPALGFAQSPPTIYTDVDKLIRSGEEVKALGSDLFGEKINMYNGSIEFIQTDVSLPGNNALPVSVGRKFTPGNQNGPQGLFGGWELEIPHLHGIFAKQGTSGTPPAPAGCGDFPAPAGRTYQGGSYNADEFWYGSFVSIPGLGDEEMLGYPSTNLSPTDGNSWPLITRSLWAINCLSNGGFVVVTPDGNRYQFDRPVTRPYPSLEKSTPLAERAARAADSRNDRDTQPASTGPITNTANGYLLPREEKWILPSQVTDRFGNTVTYTYDAAHPWRLLSIVASDGRRLDLTYSSSNDTVSTVTDGQRTWTYSYALYTPGGYSTPFNYLVQITQPDNSAWHFSMNPLTPGSQIYGAQSVECDTTGISGSNVDVGSMTHPSGATGSFSIGTVSHPRSFVPHQCTGGEAGDPASQWAYYPKYISNKAIVSKTISGPGVPAESWSYAYSSIDGASWSDCSGSCPDSITTEVTDPRGVLTRSTFGTRFRVSEGQLQKMEVISSGNTYRTTTMTYRAPDAGPYAAAIGQSFQQRGNGDLASRFTPQDQRVINQQAVDFVWQADGNSFDSMARPHTVSRSSSLGSRQETTAYEDNTVKWVLGQVKSVTEASTGKVMVSNVYDATTASLLSKRSFGRLESQFTYNISDGTLATKADGLNQTTTFSNYSRGIAQNILYADNTTESAVVDNSGNITSVTDTNGYSMIFGYDAAGRLSQINYPAGDSVAWNSTNIVFESVPVSEVDLDAGHWRQTVSTGNKQTVTYFDALLRPRLTKTLDLGVPATTKTILRRFDSDNRKIFDSYPAQTITSVDASVPGVGTVYDALGRVAQTNADSELNPSLLTTTTAYVPGFQKQVSNPRGYTTAMSFQAFDQPVEDSLVLTVAPEDQTTTISRDVFGKATSITRSGSYQGTPVSITRSYVYNTYGEVLCKTVEPETGATIQNYDLAGNTTWRSVGAGSTSATSCDLTSAPSASKTSFTYDTRNRLLTTSYGDNSPGISRTYKPDGLPATVSANGSVWTYDYNHRRLRQQEDMAAGGLIFHFGKTYDANGHLAQLTYPDTSVLTYDVNALGEVTQVGTYASNIHYWPNGAVASYTLGNGIVHTSAQNVRQLPSTLTDLSIYYDTLTYDRNGNIDSINDQQDQGANSRSMGYDGLDRLTTANAPNLWGAGSYAYDPVDNMRSSIVGTRSSLHVYDPQNRLQYIRNGGGDTDYYYDVQGNVINKGTQGFYFDQGNRLQLATGVASYTYDGLGHRTSIAGVRYQIYDQANQMLFTRSVGGTTGRFIYLSGKLIAETYSDIGTNYIHSDSLGSPVARTNSNTTPGIKTRYEPYGGTAAGTEPSPFGFTGHVNDIDTGLVYMQQRYYDPLAGRFLSDDPVVTDVSNGAAFGRYHYASNNPYRYTDPDGRLSCEGQTGGCEIINYVSSAATNMSNGASAAWSSFVQGAQSSIGQFAGSLASGLDSFQQTELGHGLQGLPPEGFVVGGAKAGLMLVAGAAKGAANFSRELKAADLGIKGTVQELRGTFAVTNGAATMRIDMIRGTIENPLQIMRNAAATAQASGATSLRIEGTIGNEQLYKVLQRYGVQSSGATDAVPNIPMR